MLVLPRYRHLDIPVFDTGTTEVLTSKSQYRAAAEAGLPTFVRVIDIRVPVTIESLTQCLGIADREFARLAEHCGALVVEHTWGLINEKTAEQNGIGPRSFNRMSKKLLPSGHLLVAEVGVVSPIPSDQDVLDTIDDGVEVYYQEGGEYMLTDFTKIWEQFVFGADAKNRNPEPNAWIVDIDPCFRRRQT